jgi:uncharacterized oligopeptide transporter (OPT) family protein
MSLMARGIVSGEMPWPLVIAGMFLAVGLILIKAPSPMLIAVGMYLPFAATAGIFVGGIFRAVMDRGLEKDGADDENRLKAENRGVLISSGLIAGGALTAVIIAFIVLGYNLLGTPPPGTEDVPTFFDSARNALGFSPNPWLGLIAFAGVFYLLAMLPLKAARGDDS